MFPNLKAEMARYGLSCAQIAASIGRSISGMDNRLRGKATLSISEAIIIHDKFFPNMSYDYLFAGEPVDAKGSNMKGNKH